MLRIHLFHIEHSIYLHFQITIHFFILFLFGKQKRFRLNALKYVRHIDVLLLTKKSCFQFIENNYIVTTFYNKVYLSKVWIQKF